MRAYGRNFDYPIPLEGRMVKQQLARIAMDAAKLHNALQDDDDLPAWVLLKVNTAEDRLHMAADYMRYKIKPGLEAYYAGTGYGADEEVPEVKRSYTRDFLIFAGAAVAAVTVLDMYNRAKKA